MIANPFTYGKPISSPSRFMGRQREAQQIFGRLRNAEFESSSLVGERRVGKSSLLNYLAHIDVRGTQGFDPVKYLFTYVDLQMVDKDVTPTRLWQRLLRQLGRLCQNTEVKQMIEETNKQETIDSFALNDLFNIIDEHDLYVIFLLDEFETVIENPNFDTDFFNGLRSLALHHHLALVTASRQELIELTRSEVIRSSPFFNMFANINLRLFSEDEAQQLISLSLKGTNVQFTPEEIDFILRIAGCYPYFLQAACCFLFDAYAMNVSGEERLSYLRKRFREEAQPHLAKYWDYSDDQEKIVLTALALLQQQKAVDGHSFSLRKLQDLYAHSEPTLAQLEKRSLLTLKADTYRLFNESFGEWIHQELINTVVDYQSYEAWLNANRETMDRMSNAFKKEMADVLPKISSKYREMIVNWVSDPKNFLVAVSLLKTVLGFI